MNLQPCLHIRCAPILLLEYTYRNPARYLSRSSQYTTHKGVKSTTRMKRSVASVKSLQKLVLKANCTPVFFTSEIWGMSLSAH